MFEALEMQLVVNNILFRCLQPRISVLAIEGSTSTVPTSTIFSGGNEVGETCEVTISKKKYSGKVAAKG